MEIFGNNLSAYYVIVHVLVGLRDFVGSGKFRIDAEPESLT
jgi:hypothetical protein